MSPQRSWVTAALLSGGLGLGCSSTTTAILPLSTAGASSASGVSSGTSVGTSQGSTGTSSTGATGTAGTSSTTGSASTGVTGTAASSGSASSTSGSSGTSGGAPCVTSLSCGGGQYCNTTVPDGACCPTLGSAVSVDGSSGVDGPCCGSSASNACLTIGQAMANVVAAGQSSVTLEASLAAGTTDWGAPESWPITLSNGVTLHAPDIFFAGSGSNDLFLTSGALLTVTIQGDLGHPVNVGLNSQYQASSTAHALTVAGGSSLLLQDVWVGGQVGIEVGTAGVAAGHLNLGPDPVVIGSLARSLKGTVGISCQGQNALAQSTISDSAGGAGPVLEVEAQSQEGLLVGDFCTVTLTQTPTFGPTPVMGTCPPAPRRDQVGVSVLGASQVNLTNAILQCQNKDGIDLAAGDSNGAPNVTLSSSTLSHNGCVGLQAAGGIAALSGTSVVTLNHYGVVAANGSVTLNGGLGAGTTTIACNSASEPGACQSDPNTIDVWQQGSGDLNANGVTWANTAPPLVYTCSPNLASCTWNDGSPHSGTLPAGAELVVSTQATGLVTDANAASASGVCP